MKGRKNNKINANKVVASTATENNDTTALVSNENKDTVSSDASEEDSKNQDITITYENFLKYKNGRII